MNLPTRWMDLYTSTRFVIAQYLDKIVIIRSIFPFLVWVIQEFEMFQ